MSGVGGNPEMICSLAVEPRAFGAAMRLQIAAAEARQGHVKNADLKNLAEARLASNDGRLRGWACRWGIGAGRRG
jgi:hypothetical protein